VHASPSDDFPEKKIQGLACANLINFFRVLKMKKNIRVRLRGYDHKLLDNAVAEIVERVKRTGSRVAGPIPLPTSISRYTVLRSPHVDKKSREQFEVRTHKRMLDILDMQQQTIDALYKLDLSSGVDVTLKELDN